MGHCIQYGVYSENVNKKSVQAEWDDYAAHEDWQEGCSGLPSNIRWIDHICNNREEAEEYIRQHDSGWYDQLAVKFRDTDGLKETSYIKEKLLKQINAYKIKKETFDKAHSLSNLKAEFVSCPHCKSKLARIYLLKYGRANGCPVCRSDDIRAEYIIKQLLSYQEKIEKWNNQVKLEERKIADKNSGKCKILWLVKVEFHV